MFAPWEKISELFELLTPYRNKSKVRDFFCDLKVKRNCEYICKNSKAVLNKLKNKIKNEPLKVVFHVYDESKWKSQSLYDLMVQDKHFNPKIVVTKTYADKAIVSAYQPPESVNRYYNFFKNKGMNVQYGYDVENEKFISFSEFEPDIIIYQNPWYIEKHQGPVVTSKFALSYYVPYFIATSLWEHEYNLRFHQYLHAHYVLNGQVKNYYAKNMKNKGKNLRVVGHPQLDYFYLNKDKPKEKKYVIYAPHWSFADSNPLKWGIFDKNGDFILDYARKHPEINWIFKPHPSLRLNVEKFISKDYAEKYYDEWAKIGTCYETGDYLDLFMQSKLLITDCGSFLTEYFITGSPVIRLVAENANEYNDSVKEIVKTYYNVYNNEDLEKRLNELLFEGNDPLKDERKATLQKMNLVDNYAAKNILDDIKKELGILN